MEVVMGMGGGIVPSQQFYQLIPSKQDNNLYTSIYFSKDGVEVKVDILAKKSLSLFERIVNPLNFLSKANKWIKSKNSEGEIIYFQEKSLNQVIGNQDHSSENISEMILKRLESIANSKINSKESQDEINKFNHELSEVKTNVSDLIKKVGDNEITKEDYQSKIIELLDNNELFSYFAKELKRHLNEGSKESLSLINKLYVDFISGVFSKEVAMAYDQMELISPFDVALVDKMFGINNLDAMNRFSNKIQNEVMHSLVPSEASFLIRGLTNICNEIKHRSDSEEKKNLESLKDRLKQLAEGSKEKIFFAFVNDVFIKNRVDLIRNTLKESNVMAAAASYESLVNEIKEELFDKLLFNKAINHLLFEGDAEKINLFENLIKQGKEKNANAPGRLEKINEFEKILSSKVIID